MPTVERVESMLGNNAGRCIYIEHGPVFVDHLIYLKPFFISEPYNNTAYENQ